MLRERPETVRRELVVEVAPLSLTLGIGVSAGDSTSDRPCHLISGLEQHVQRQASADELTQHLDGIAAIMESHFRYEERQLLTVLETLDLEAEARAVFGPR